MVNSTSGYIANLNGRAFIVPYLVSTFNPRDSITLNGIIILEALESIMQFFKVFPFIIRLRKNGSISSVYATDESSNKI